MFPLFKEAETFTFIHFFLNRFFLERRLSPVERKNTENFPIHPSIDPFLWSKDVILEGEHQDVAYCVNPGRDLTGEIKIAQWAELCHTEIDGFFGGDEKKIGKVRGFGGSKFELFIIS